MLIKSTNTLFVLLYLSVIFVYCYFLAPIGFEFWDTGYIPSFSWRIVNGEIPYRDFIYKGPPVTLYFHAFWMNILPNESQFLLIKMVNYILFALQVFLVVSGYFNHYIKEVEPINKWGIMIVCFIISVLNFSPYPWPTPDGLLFASIAFYLSSQKKLSLVHLILIAFFAMLAAFTKQSFYPVPLLFLAWISMQYKWKKGLIFLLFSFGFLALFLIGISSLASFHQFVDQTTGETKLEMLFSTGFLNFFWFYPNKWFYYALIIVGTLILLYFKSKKNSIGFKTILGSLAVVIFILALFVSVSNSFLIGSKMAFLACFLGLTSALIGNFSNLKSYSTLYLLMGISWCCAISLGYPYPIFFGTGIILVSLVIFKEELFLLRKYNLLYPLSIVLCLSAFATNRYPYREQNYKQLTYTLDEISPKLVGIKTSKYNLEKLGELKKLIQKFQTPYIVAPNLSQAHYLFNDLSILPSDWLINTEINKNPELFITIAKNSKAIIFLEKSFLENELFMTEKKEDFSLIANYIYKNFKTVGETNYFIIYQGIEKNEPVPKIN